MFDVIVTFLQFLSTLSPLAVIALLGVIIFMLVRGKQQMSGQVEEISSNHLSDLPDIAETLRRIEINQSENFAWIRAKLGNGK